MVSEITRERLRLSHLGHVHSEETKRLMSIVHLKENCSPESLKKMRDVKLGKKNSPESKIKNHTASLRENCSKENLEMKRVASLRENCSEANLLGKRTKHLKENCSPEYLKKLHDASCLKTTHNGGFEYEDHKFTKESLGDKLTKLGYNVTLEKFVTINNIRYAVDIYAVKNGIITIFEIGHCRMKKIINLMSHYPIVLQVPKVIRN